MNFFLNFDIICLVIYRYKEKIMGVLNKMGRVLSYKITKKLINW